MGRKRTDRSEGRGATRHRVVIVGGGFGGLYAAQQLARADVEVTLVDRRNFHLFQPLLYQVATGGLSPADIASPLRAVLNRQRNTRVLQGEVVDFDLPRRRVLLKDGELAYDTLVVAAGAAPHYFGHPEWAEQAPGLKTIEDALAIRQRVFSAFEAAEREPDPTARQACLTFVIVGGGPTGVELAGALGELAHHTLKHDFRSFDPEQARILLLEGGPRLLPAFPDDLGEDAVRSLNRLGVEVRTGVQVTGMENGEIVLTTGAGEERIAARTVLWAAGMRASPLGEVLAQGAGLETDRGGRLVVQPDLTLPGHPEVYVIGDLANYAHQDGKPLPGVAPVAIQQGTFVARRIAAHDRGEAPAQFWYTDKGSMAVIGRHAAVSALGRFRLNGYPAWLAWMFIHILYLVEFDNQLSVLLQWAWSYWTKRRGARLITPNVTLPLSGPTPIPAPLPAPVAAATAVRTPEPAETPALATT